MGYMAARCSHLSDVNTVFELVSECQRDGEFYLAARVPRAGHQLASMMAGVLADGQICR